MSLTDTAIRKAKPGITSKGKTTDRPYKLADAGGLYLEVAPSGGKWWRFKYRFRGKEKRLSLGVYPETTLKEAREKHQTARKQLSQGIDPGATRKALKSSQVQIAETFEVIAREWHNHFLSQWTTGHAETIKSRLERDVFPWIGARPVAEVKAPEVLALLRRVESRGALEMAHRIRTICGQVFRYAVATGRAERDPSADLKGALPAVKEKHYAAITDPAKVAPLLRAIDDYQGSFVVKCALKLAPMLFCRPGELRQAEWTEIDFETAEWNLPAEKMKTREPHLVPLSRQAVAILQELYALTGSGRYLFPSPRSSERPMSNNAILAALRRMDFAKEEMTGHGFRAMARTILDEVLGFRPELIEHQLAHAVRDPLGRAYNRTSHLPARRKMMQAWADYLDGLKVGAKIIPMRASG